MFEVLGVLGEMLPRREALEVFDLVVERIPVDVMNVVARGNGSVSVPPDIPVQ